MLNISPVDIGLFENDLKYPSRTQYKKISKAILQGRRSQSEKTDEELRDIIGRILKHLECQDEVIESLIKRVNYLEYISDLIRYKHSS